MKNKIKVSFLQLICLMIIPGLIMSIIMGSLVYNSMSRAGTVNKTNNKHVNEFISAYNKLIDSYYEDLDESKLIDAAIKGMFNYTGDDYTNYMDEDATNVLNERLNGTYDGIGINIAEDSEGQIIIKDVFENTPASEAGLKENDIILYLNGTDLEDYSISEVSEVIKNNTSDNVTLKILRNNEELDFEIKKKTLISPNIYSSIKEINNKKIGYILIESFSNTVDTQIETTLISMEKENIDSLILDVRGNSGGYLNSCTNILELFLEKGKVIYSVQTKDDKTEYKDKTEEKRNYPIVVLINGGSASASEILAGALKYSYGATLIGTKTYGKGKVQNTGYLDDGTMYKYTSAKWLLPNGDCIDKIGIQPDINIELNEEYLLNGTEEYDNQLNEALNYLSK